MKNVVVVSGNRLAPATTGGQIHSLSIARALARIGHSVHIFSTAGAERITSAKICVAGIRWR